MTTRRDFFKNLGMAGGAVAAASVSSVALAALPELVSMDNPDTASPLTPPNGRPYNPDVPTIRSSPLTAGPCLGA